MSKLELAKLYISLFRIDLSLQLFGFEKLFQRYMQLYSLDKVNSQKTRGNNYIEDINKMLESIDYICTVYPRSAQCMHRSFLGYQYLRKKFHLPVELVVGVRKMPFSAHAWLVLNGQNINEDSQYTDQFQIILSTEEGAL
ncbi:lasso peptide biosynthesis B2 protein [Paenibacillus sp. FSL R5-0623]|uniref:lasso peptide biosynthesis B2 protein n=1 Tax=Paenibacillus sp. FSL R5-0623 TaxID=2921651 RepID=UPI0030D75726